MTYSDDIAKIMNDRTDDNDISVIVLLLPEFILVKAHRYDNAQRQEKCNDVTSDLTEKQNICQSHCRYRYNRRF